MHENIFGTFYGYIAHLMETFMTASSLGTSKISSSNVTIFINSILNVYSGLDFFFLSITDGFVNSLICSAKWLKKKTSPWSKAGTIKLMREWYVIYMCVSVHYCVRERGPRQREVPWERLLVIAILCWPRPFLLCVPPNNWDPILIYHASLHLPQ